MSALQKRIERIENTPQAQRAARIEHALETLDPSELSKADIAELRRIAETPSADESFNTLRKMMTRASDDDFEAAEELEYDKIQDAVLRDTLRNFVNERTAANGHTRKAN
jgi:hypothetical protein